MLRKVLFCTPAMLVIVGCTHDRLQINTIATSRTWSDIQYQQVADNLAMLAYNPEMLPYFIVIGQGSVEVADSVALSGGLEWEPSSRATRTLGLDLGREAKAEWEIAPVTYPERLDWMRTAYLCALESEDHTDWKKYPCLEILDEFKGWYPPYPKWEPKKVVPTDDSPPKALRTDHPSRVDKFGKFSVLTGPVEDTDDVIVVGVYRNTKVVIRKNRMKDLRLLTTLILHYATIEFEDEKEKDFYNPSYKGIGG